MGGNWLALVSGIRQPGINSVPLWYMPGNKSLAFIGLPVSVLFPGCSGNRIGYQRPFMVKETQSRGLEGTEEDITCPQASSSLGHQ